MTFVVAESLFVKVSEETKRLDTYIRAFNGALQETPEVLHAVRVYVSFNVRLGMIDYVVSVVNSEAVISQVLIRHQVRSVPHVLMDFGLQNLFAPIRDDGSSHLTGFTFQQTEDYSLTKVAPTAHLIAPILVHEASLAADVRFVGLDFASHFVDGSVMHGVADTMIHEPSCLLGYLDGPGDLIRADAVLAVGNEPHCTEPLLERDWAVFEDRADLDGELLPTFEARPQIARCQERKSITAATRTGWTLRTPLRFLSSLEAYLRVGKVLDSALQTFWNFGVDIAHV